ncbi:ABC transporter G family member 6-like, partial [Dendrobium catenatum]|uniref:ABC transporter G family member 6-like n=1 Tax=Dendrobium catenatum TaxID=906689 RepID=UPI00109FCF3E
SAKLAQFTNPFYVELSILTRRSFTNTWRMPEIFFMRLGTILVTGGIFATFFFRLDLSPRGVQERFGFFALAMSTIYYTCTDSLPVFLQELYIFFRETAYNSYRRSSYVLSNSLVALPSFFILSLAFASATFTGVGLANGPSGFLFYFLIILASFWAGSGFVSFLSAIVSQLMLGYFAVVAMLGYFLLFSGFFINRNRIPDYWIWFHYLSLVKYSYEGVLQNEFGEGGKCFVRGVQIFDTTPLGEMAERVKEGVLMAAGRA